MRRRGDRAKRLGKADLILLFVLLAAGIAAFFSVRLLTQKGGTQVKVLLRGELYGTYRLLEDQSVSIRQNGVVTNVMQIQDGKASMIQADCPDKLCVHQKAIDKQGETIVCLPNQVVIEVEGALEAGLDSVSR